MPAERPNTCVAEMRCDRRVLASLAVYYKKKPRQPRSTSELLRAIIYDYHQLLLDHEMVVEIETTAEAVEIMDELQFTGLNRMGRGSKTLSEQISKEAIEAVNKASKVFEKFMETEDESPD